MKLLYCQLMTRRARREWRMLLGTMRTGERSAALQYSRRAALNDLTDSSNDELKHNRNHLVMNNEHSNGLKFDPRYVTLCYRPTQKVFDIDLESADELSVFLRHREELINLSISSKFKDLLKEVQSDNHKEVPRQPLESIDELLPIEGKKLDYRSLPLYYLRLSKMRLTGLVVSTQIAGYLIAPGQFDMATFALCTVGTALVSSSANAINQYMEIEFDSKMKRTKNRPLVMKHLSDFHALMFAGLTGFSGTLLLSFGVNPLTSLLGFTNLLLYTAVYTPMKRRSIINTWVGSVVGAIPPMMGWVASSGSLNSGALLLGAIMYAWQFPHFCALSWNLRGDYSQAGYRMMAVSHPDLCRRVALRYSIVMVGLCTMAPYVDVTSWWFAVDSLPFNAYLVYLSYKFYRDGDSSSSRRLFHYSLLHVPAIMILMLISKKRTKPAQLHTSLSSLKQT